MYGSLGIAALGSWIVGSLPAAIVVLLAAAVIFFLRQLKDKYVLSRRFAEYHDDYRDDSTRSISNDHRSHNVIIYRGFFPFSSFGSQFYGVSLSVDVKRPAKGASFSSKNLEVPSVLEMEERVARSLKQVPWLDKPTELFFAQGANIPFRLRGGSGARPPFHIDSGKGCALAAFRDAPLRRYLWLPCAAWSGELVVSYFVRIIQAEGRVNDRIHGVFAGPIDPK